MREGKIKKPNSNYKSIFRTYNKVNNNKKNLK